jgi:hypothetical protein
MAFGLVVAFNLLVICYQWPIYVPHAYSQYLRQWTTNASFPEPRYQTSIRESSLSFRIPVLRLVLRALDLIRPAARHWTPQPERLLFLHAGPLLEIGRFERRRRALDGEVEFLRCIVRRL